LTAVSSYVLISLANVQYLKRAGNIDGGCFIVMITDGGRLIGWNITGYISDSSNVSGRLETDDLVEKKDGELGRKEVELGDNAIDIVGYVDDRPSGPRVETSAVKCR